MCLFKCSFFSALHIEKRQILIIYFYGCIVINAGFIKKKLKEKSNKYIFHTLPHNKSAVPSKWLTENGNWQKCFCKWYDEDILRENEAEEITV